MSYQRKETTLIGVFNQIETWEGISRQTILDRMIASYIRVYQPAWNNGRRNTRFILKPKRKDPLTLSRGPVETVDLDDGWTPPAPAKEALKPVETSASVVDLQSGFRLMASYYFRKEADWSDLRAARTIFLMLDTQFAIFMQCVEGYIAKNEECSFTDLLVKGPTSFSKKSNIDWTPSRVREELDAMGE